MSSNQSSLATPVIKWAHREDDQYCHVLLPFDRVFTVTLFENTADRERFNSHLRLSEREGSLHQLAYYLSWRHWRNSLTCFQKTNSRQQRHTGVFNVCCTHLILPTPHFTHVIFREWFDSTWFFSPSRVQRRSAYRADSWRLFPLAPLTSCTFLYHYTTEKVT